MSLYAQNGYGEGNKVKLGLANNVLKGVIYSPKDISSDKIQDKIAQTIQVKSDTEILFDPQFYINSLRRNPKLNIGKLESYKDEYFEFHTRNSLELSNNVNRILERAINYQRKLGINKIIAPNILISNSFDSIEAAIAKSFIRSAGQYQQNNEEIYATLSVSAEAMQNTNEFQEFLNSITLLDNPSKGFYIIITSRSSSSAMQEIFNTELIANWLLLNYSLVTNGYKIINGYSDIIWPVLKVVGNISGATGWFSNLRFFCLERFLPSPDRGGSQPITRYLSNALFTRLRFDELNMLSNRFPEILNGLSQDVNYLSDNLNRDIEILQTWESLKRIAQKFNNDILQNIETLMNYLDEASTLYNQVTSVVGLDSKSNIDHFDSIREGVGRFMRLAEL
jgi:hypothetical protein